MSQADWANKDFYKVLGVDKDADAGAIKKAYRKLARENHPDSKQGDPAAEERFKQVAEAYDVDGTAISLRLSSESACETRPGTGGKPGTKPHVCPTCGGAGMVVNNMGGGFAMNETCPQCHGSQVVYDEPCPTCHGSGRGRSS